MYDVTMFMSPQQLKAHNKRETEYRNNQLKRAVEWDENKTKFNKMLLLKGKGFNEQTKRHQLFDSKPTSMWPRDNKKVTEENGFTWSPSGKYVYANRILKRPAILELAQGKNRGEVMFDADVTIPILAEWTDKSYGDHPISVWMSITPMEILTQRQGIRLAKGKVLVGGLGLGWQLLKIAKKNSVEEIVVVEIDQELIDWYGKDLVASIAKETGKKITIICDDVTNQVGKHGDETRHILDIWKRFPTYVDDWDFGKELRAALKDVKHWWGWGVLAEPPTTSW